MARKSKKRGEVKESDNRQQSGTESDHSEGKLIHGDGNSRKIQLSSNSGKSSNSNLIFEDMCKRKVIGVGESSDAKNHGRSDKSEAENKLRAAYARVLVEVEFREKLKEEVWFEDETGSQLKRSGLSKQKEVKESKQAVVVESPKQQYPNTNTASLRKESTTEYGEGSIQILNHKAQGRSILWESLKTLSHGINEAWLILGDFNYVMQQNERLGGREEMNSDSGKFKQLVEECELWEMSMQGGFFTWSNKQYGDMRILSKLDRSFINEHWENVFPEAYTTILNAGISDHNALLVKWGEEYVGKKKSFSFFNMWLQDQECKTIVKECWRKEVEGTSQYRMIKKQQMLKKPLRDLNKRKFSNIEEAELQWRKKLEDVQEALKTDPFNTQLQQEEKGLALGNGGKQYTASSGYKWLKGENRKDHAAKTVGHGERLAGNNYHPKQVECPGNAATVEEQKGAIESVLYSIHATVYHVWMERKYRKFRDVKFEVECCFSKIQQETSALKELRTKHRHGRISASHDLNRNPDRSPDPEPEENVVAVLDLPRGPKPVEEFKQNDLAITEHAEMVDAFKKRMGYSNKFLPTRSMAAQLVASRKDYGDDFKQDFLVFVAAESRFAIIIERLQRQVADQQQQQHQQTCDNTVQAPIDPTNFQDIEIDKAQGLEQLSETNDGDSLPVRKFVHTSKEVVVDEQQTQSQVHGTNMSTTKRKRNQEKQKASKACERRRGEMADNRSHQDSTGQDRDTQVEDKAKSNQESTKMDSGVTPTTNQTGATSTYTRRTRSTGTRKKKVVKDPTIPHFGMVPAPVEETNNPSHSIKNITGSVDSDKDVDETIEAEEYPVPSALNKTKNPTPSINKVIRRASAPASKSLSETRKLEMIAAAAEQVEKNSKVVEAVPISIIPPDWNIASTTGGLLMLEKNECTMPPPAISKEADELDEELTKTVENNKDDMEFSFYERLALELEEQGLTVASLLAVKAFQFFKNYIACVFPSIELVSTQYTFTEVKLPSHKDKTPNGEDCRIYTMHHMERYDGGEYEDGTTLDFNTGNIKDYWWKYMIRILMYPVNKNKNKILEAMHQFYTNTAEEKQKEIPDHVDLSSESYYNDRKTEG
ncbi:OLC1v1008029C1 [Oldenlandia corymbosa var. corymbosa]|uniref:OLC1v1008029C1 n=1 Tax=Oldenlandia corymbosa var. corymbosa TaxID=529605 RepID=A0AAV1DKN5_OLDCO|nr:OLC1v1008029C1 [Oldenlandia corymbosa var. corymbosa]